MSHYSVAVFANRPNEFEDLLAPYSEESHFTRHVVDEAELRERYKKFLVQNPSWKKHGFDYYLEEMNYKREGDEIVSYYNDNAKWDWYNLDGRSYMFDLKPDVDPEDGWPFRKNDYDYDTPDYDYNPERLARFWEIHVEGDSPGGDEEIPFALYNKEYYLQRFGTKYNFIKAGSRTRPYAFVTPDGVWHAPGTVGWFASDDATAESCEKYDQEWDDYIASEENPYVNFVDCHI